MAGIYYTDMLDVLRAAGCQVRENSTTNGWQSRSRSSGGFPAPPLGVWWHHTASETSPENDLSYMINGSSDRPVGNLLLDRDGAFWPIAAGASNCAGKGGPWTFSRGVCPVDQGNTHGFQLEVQNGGTSEPWNAAQMEAYFRGSNALNAHVGNRPDDVVSHAAYAPTRKIDPAMASSVQGPWKPRSTNSSGTWNLDDIKAECLARSAGPAPAPDVEEDDMTTTAYLVAHPGNGKWYVTDMATYRTHVTEPGLGSEGAALFGWQSADGKGKPWGLGPGWGPFLDQLPETCP